MRPLHVLKLFRPGEIRSSTGQFTITTDSVTITLMIPCRRR